MQLTAIDATLKQIADQLPKAQTRTNAPDVFQSLVESLSRQIRAAIEDAAAEGGAPAASPGAPAASAASAGRTTSQLTPFQQSLLREPGGAMLEQLSDELTAESPLYNERESTLRDGLDLSRIERRLQETARGLGVTYDRSDLDGILRNAGYGAAHLGSTERYMASVEKFIGEAERRYRERAGNAPGAVS
mgnify:CR=1 FL=1